MRWPQIILIVWIGYQLSQDFRHINRTEIHIDGRLIELYDPHQLELELPMIGRVRVGAKILAITRWVSLAVIVGWGGFW